MRGTTSERRGARGEGRGARAHLDPEDALLAPLEVEDEGVEAATEGAGAAHDGDGHASAAHAADSALAVTLPAIPRRAAHLLKEDHEQREGGPVQGEGQALQRDKRCPRGDLGDRVVRTGQERQLQDKHQHAADA